ncbi:MAG: geranylgeranylglyceryl/heptaprenylglyceryl phosphate synthase [Salibacteraceae bacterium]
MNDDFISKLDQKLAVLIDPDQHSTDSLFDFMANLKSIKPDYILIGGSLITNSSVDQTAKAIKALTKIPVVLFPGHFTHLTNEVDAILLLSLISGRNPDLLIGQHVIAASQLKTLKDKLIPTGYMLIDGGCPTSVSYISNTNPIPRDKPEIACATAIAGQSIGQKVVYMDAGSGAKYPISDEMIRSVSKSIDIPLIVGGGIRTVEAINQAWENGANLVVVGNALEEDPSILSKNMAQLKHR